MGFPDVVSRWVLIHFAAIISVVMQTCGDEEQGREGLQQAKAPSERRLSPHVSPGFDLLLWFDSCCFCGVDNWQTSNAAC